MNAQQMIDHAEKLSKDYDPGTGRIRKRSNRSGLYRHTFVEGGYAFKAVGRDGDNTCNVAEWDFYCMTTDEIRKWLAKPVYISENGNVIVMEVLKVRQDMPDNKQRAWSERAGASERALIRLVERTHNGLCLSDLHGGNWGEDQNGTLKCLDYGYIAYGAEHDGHYDKMTLAEWTCPELVSD